MEFETALFKQGKPFAESRLADAEEDKIGASESNIKLRREISLESITGANAAIAAAAAEPRNNLPDN